MAEQLIKLLEAVEDLDDVQKVDANFDMDDSAIPTRERRTQRTMLILGIDPGTAVTGYGVVRTGQPHRRWWSAA